MQAHTSWHPAAWQMLLGLWRLGMRGSGPQSPELKGPGAASGLQRPGAAYCRCAGGSCAAGPSGWPFGVHALQGHGQATWPPQQTCCNGICEGATVQGRPAHWEP